MTPRLGILQLAIALFVVVLFTLATIQWPELDY
jgi:hypothetical protein